jgi:hypothetical protein
MVLREIIITSIIMYLLHWVPGEIIIVGILLYLQHDIFSQHHVAPSTIPWVGLRSELFSRTRAHWREINSSKQNLKEGYAKVNPSALYALYLKDVNSMSNSTAKKDSLSSPQILHVDRRLSSLGHK